MAVQERFKSGLTIKNTRAREEIRALGGESVALFWTDSGAFLCFFLLAQEGKPLLPQIHRKDHQQTKHHQKEENHAHRIAQTNKFVLYSGFAITKQLCKRGFDQSDMKISLIHHNFIFGYVYGYGVNYYSTMDYL